MNWKVIYIERPNGQVRSAVLVREDIQRCCLGRLSPHFVDRYLDTRDFSSKSERDCDNVRARMRCRDHARAARGTLAGV